ncbi:hypothetical protein CXG81DRAFT_12455 [Caulochytrium protostelioides]|uniref:Cystathionine beta-synthase n=1 Tax=Caulochytrium protostelioides TaxID=1555241 RepID=A0A4P9X762_9FUNG|nr:hypothetical protein CXG81DRAFT_12455 [Caulochytrium protostelioides]|eukprot:RKP01042.1 hypothetical protein CXG81DRAFT_12455 [Caulochytrium protostelioides]
MTAATSSTDPRHRIYDTVLEHIGNTPMIRLNRIAKAAGLQCELVAKCEFYNAGGSVKDRIAKRMVEMAEKEGRLVPGRSTIIEPTSGNTGIGLALTAAVKGYRTIITLPEKMSKEKVDVLKALGAEIIRTPTEAAWDAPDSHIGVARRLEKEIPDALIPDQYSNVNNPMAHYEGTAEEIIAQCDGKIDMFVAGAGTGGTVAGVGRKLKEKIPGVEIVAADPKGSILALPASLNAGGVHGYQVEGIGYDFVPEVLNRDYIDRWIKTDDAEAFVMARRLIREEGLLCGGSSGTAVVAAIEAARDLKPGQRCVVLLPDSVRNYMTKFLSEEWMLAHHFIEPPTDSPPPPLATGKASNKQHEHMKLRWGAAKVRDLQLAKAVAISADATVEDAIGLMQQNGYDQLPVYEASADGKRRLVGQVTLGNVMSHVASGRAQLADPVAKPMFHFKTTESGTKFKPITPETPLEDLQDFFNAHSSAVVTSAVTGNEEPEILHVVTKIDLMGYLIKINKKPGSLA